jgi:hypothetical protein
MPTYSPDANHKSFRKAEGIKPTLLSLQYHKQMYFKALSSSTEGELFFTNFSYFFEQFI